MNLYPLNRMVVMEFNYQCFGFYGHGTNSILINPVVQKILIITVIVEIPVKLNT